MEPETAQDFSIAVVGSPNSGKTTLFNTLTGSRQKTANYAGVTVERKEGRLRFANGESALLIDLPGTYSLDARTPDEEITTQVLAGLRSDAKRPDFVVAVSDSTNLEVNLYLVLQLIERRIPLILALTMSDLAKKQGSEINVALLEKELGVPVLAVSAKQGEGIAELTAKIAEHRASSGTALAPRSAAPLHAHALKSGPDAIVGRYARIEKILKSCLRTKAGKRIQTSKRLDRVFLHRIWGPILLVLALALMFQSIFSFAELPKSAIERGVALLGDFVRTALPAGAFQSLIVDGVIAGVGSVIVFLPQILLLFGFILLFEDTGYLARATFILDRLMSAIGLNGRAFIPLLSSFACAIPGIMATRTIESRRDRLITILISPLMTCSARLPVYALFISAFIPKREVFGFLNLQGLVLFSLYFGGIAFAIAVAFVLRRTVYRGDNSKFVMELPTYKTPSLRNLALGLWDRSRIFLTRAGTIILATTVLLWCLANFPKTQAPEHVLAQGPAAVAAHQLRNSFAGRAGTLIEPLIRPLGFDWRIGIGIISSFAAREVIVSTLSTVFAVQGDGAEQELSRRLAADPVFSLPTVLALLVFYMLACQCTSTLAVVRRETNSWRWPAIMFAYMTVLAYLAALVVRHIAIFLHL